MMQKIIKTGFLYPFSLLVIMLLTTNCQNSIKKKKQPVSEINLAKENWLFKTGDEINWANPNYVPGNWNNIQTGKSWHQEGVEDYKGKAWYRLSINIPSDFKKNIYFQSKNYLNLHLGKIGDADRTFFNGKFIGQTGNFKPFKKEKRTERIYKIPAKYIKWDQPNTISIRVLAKEDNKRGLYKGTPKITCPALSDYSKTQITPSSQNGIFYGKDKLLLNYKLTLASAHPFPLESELQCVITSDKHKPDTIYKLISAPLIVSPGQHSKQKFSFSTLTPGFYHFHFNIINQQDTLDSRFFRVGYEPEKLPGKTYRNEDLELFWEATKNQLKVITPDFQANKIDSLGNDLVEVYRISMNSLNNVRIYGWYCIPKAEGTFPVMLELPWYGGELPPRDNLTDFVILTLHTRGHGMSCDSINPGFPEYLWHNIENQKGYIYQGAYMDCIRAIDFLCTRPEADTSKLAVFGVSQGGGLTLASAALDDRVKLAVSAVPFLSNFPVYFQHAKWIENELLKELENNPNLSRERIYKTLEYIDVTNLAPWINCPVHMSIGLQDQVCPPIINFSVYNKIKSKKNIKVYPQKGHDATSPDEMIEHIRSFFNN